MIIFACSSGESSPTATGQNNGIEKKVAIRLPGLYLLARSSMVTVITKDYLRTAKAKGLGSWRIFYW